MKEKRNIAILGVDGTGKSSVIKNIVNKLDGGVVVQYMGYRSFQNPGIEFLIEKKEKNVLERIKLMFIVYFDFRKRVKASLKSDSCVIYDRYVHEIYINAIGKSQFLYKILYKYLFPSPDFIVYLYCSAQASFDRKDDILDKEQFIKMKMRFDDEFLNNQQVLALDTERYNSEELATIIIEKAIKR